MADPLRRWRCQICGWIYDEERGDSAAGLAPGTRWRDVPDDWVCPDCSAAKVDFVMVELAAEFTENEDRLLSAEHGTADIVLGARTEGCAIDARMRTVVSAGQSQSYRSVVVVSGSNLPPDDGSNSGIRALSLGELVLDDGLRAPAAVDRPEESLWARLKGWWWGA